MSVQIQVRPDGDTTVVTLRGVADGTVLQRLGDTRAVAAVTGLVDDPDRRVADRARAVLERLSANA